MSSSAISSQRTVQLTLLGIILATIPCYCVGFLLLAVRPAPARNAAPTNTPTPFQLATNTPIVTPSITPISPLFSPTSPIFIQPTPTQFFFFFSPTPFFPTATPIIFPTWTPFVFPTATPIIIVPPTATPVLPTSTPQPPTSTPVPPTETPIPFPTLETPTETPIPFPTLPFNTPTPETLSNQRANLPWTSRHI
ncbi:MAG: hypothetical protein RML95_07885 [Anaerolineae bacterium]|nr:hypothetical protein [Anaerolineae bacterium]MDW8299245.1 hypothetical protein [Anaerolineae bacterium]